jgi:hypothetical protein
MKDRSRPYPEKRGEQGTAFGDFHAHQTLIRNTQGSVLCVLLFLLGTGVTQHLGPVEDTAPTRIVDLKMLGYQAPDMNNTYRDQSLTFQDFHARLAFINNEVLAVYLKRPNEKAKDTGLVTMEAFFVSRQTGTLLARKTWVARFSRGLNSSVDTQASILPLRDGFLVHAGDLLYRYGQDLQMKREVSLDAAWIWAFQIAPGGDAVEALRTNQANRTEAEVEIVNASTLEFAQTMPARAARRTIGENGAVAINGDCITYRSPGSTVHDICCSDECKRGKTVAFLNENELLVQFGTGFEVLAADGTTLWRREGLHKPSIIDAQPSLEAERFVVAVTRTTSRSTFEGMTIPKDYVAIYVYDAMQRSRVFETRLQMPNSEFEEGLSFNAKCLAVLSGNTLYFYNLA